MSQRTAPLTRAVIQALMFFETCEDDVLDPETALKLAESILAELNFCSAEEWQLLESEAEAMRLEEVSNANRPDIVQFLSKFNKSYSPNL